MKVHGDEFALLVPEDTITDTVARTVKAIRDTFHDDFSSVVFIVLERGGLWLSRRITQEIGSHITVQNISVSSYQGEVRGTCTFHTYPKNVSGKHVVLVDDIMDSGATMLYVRDYLQTHEQVQSIHTCVLLRRKGTDVCPTINEPYVVDENLWLVGCGMDHHGEGRELNAVYYKQ